MTTARAVAGPSDSAGALRHLRILASAGSGKTYQLTNRYLALVNAGTEPGAILASTFTRLAAGQIRNHILARLARAIDDPATLAQLAHDLDTPGLTRARALSLLANLARNVHRMNIRTLDSFFASVTSAFALELGLPLSPRLVEDAEGAQLRAEAMQRMLDERDPQRLIDLLRLLTQGSTQRSVMDAIDDAVSKLYELWLESPAGAWDCIAARATLDHAALVEAIEALAGCELPDKKSLHAARESDLRHLQARDWSALLAKGLAAKVAAGATVYGRVTIPAGVCDLYRPLVDHAVAVLVNRARDQTLATRELLAWFHDEYIALKHRRRAMTFTDLTHAMCRAEMPGTLDEIYYRIDATIRHLLLDEFQDTSVKQWTALSPFIREVVANAPPDRTFFCVGDVKQSIYGWRDAAPDVLENMPALLGFDDEAALGRATLQKSWRSSHVVIDAVNRVFLGLPANAALAGHPDVQATWKSWFTEHSTARDLPGRVTLRTARRATDDGEEKKSDMRMQAAADMVAALHARNEALRIAVLMRTNKSVSHLLFLLSRLTVRASGRGGGPLIDAPPVNALLDLLQLADHPGDTVAAFNVATSPLADALGIDPAIATRDGRIARERLASAIRRALLERGYAGALDDWVRAIAPSCDARQLRRLLQLVELGAQFDDRPSLRTADFIGLVEQTSVEQIEPAPVQVMTIHKSKGLEFDVVVLPELDWPLTGYGTPEVVFERAGAIGPVRRIARYIRKDVRPFVPDLDPLFAADEYRTVRESLCLLYVAMTRAKQALHMIIDPPRSNEQTLPRTAAGVLRCALTSGPIDENAAVFRSGDDGWMDAPPHETTAHPEPPPPTIDRIELPPSQGAARYGVAAAPASASAHAADVADALALPEEEALDRGTAIHALLEQVEWLENFDADDESLAEVVRRHAPRRDDPWIARQVAEVRTILARGDVPRILSRGRRAESSITVRRELPFARLVDGRLQTGRIDRLELEIGGSGLPARGTLIDFKSDTVAPGEAAAHAERYRGQLEAYRAPAAAWTGLAADAIDLVVLFTGTGEAVTLG